MRISFFDPLLRFFGPPFSVLPFRSSCRPSRPPTGVSSPPEREPRPYKSKDNACPAEFHGFVQFRANATLAFRLSRMSAKAKEARIDGAGPRAFGRSLAARPDGTRVPAASLEGL